MVKRRRVDPARGRSQQRAGYNRFVLERDGYRCMVAIPGICTGLATTVDHIVPVSAAPHLALDPDNGRASCRACNRAKGTLPDALIARDVPSSRDW